MSTEIFHTHILQMQDKSLDGNAIANANKSSGPK